MPQNIALERVLPRVRLSEHDLRSLRSTCDELLPANARVYLFGSRADPSRRGGDIDLLVHVPGIDRSEALKLKLDLGARLLDRLGEQKVDIVITPSTDRAATAFIQFALLESVPLWP